MCHLEKKISLRRAKDMSYIGIKNFLTPGQAHLTLLAKNV